MVQKIIIFFVTASYVGYIKYAPGTFGTIIAVPISIFLNKFLSSTTYLSLIIFLIFSSSYICYYYEKITNKKDPSEIVLDEIIGFLIASFKIKIAFLPYFISFILFRFFDITKIFFIKRVEEKLPQGISVVIDDCLAGIYTLIIIKLIFWS